MSIKLPSESLQKEANPGFFIGNKDKKQSHQLPITWKNSVVVRESIEAKIGPNSKDVVEIPSSVKLMPYDASLFNEHVKNGMFEKKKTEIIHDPR